MKIFISHGISIKLFTILILFLILSGVSVVFINFYSTSKANIEMLLKSNIQTNSLNMKHYLDTNLNEKSIQEITSHLDTIRSTNELINNIYIFNADKKLIYSSSRTPYTYKTSECVEIFNILEVDILEQNCYTFKSKKYLGLAPYFYTIEISLSHNYLDSLFYKHSLALFIEYLVTLFFIFLFALALFSKLIKNPLEKLRQFAYYESKIPNNFFIHEIESIRYSLEMTFKRLHQEQKELYKLSTKDHLSGLYNKRSLIEKLEWLIAEKGRKGQKFTVVLLDLDNFKNVNDSMGHDIGDKVLQEVAASILNSLRSNDIVSRIGGDEFVIVLPEATLNVQIIEVLERIKANIANPIILESIRYNIASSMGNAIFPKDGEDANSLIKNADIAMYKSKENGKNTYHFFNDSFNIEIQQKIAMQNLILSSYENNYFKLYYQPKVDLATNKALSCEALLRLVHPQEGMIPPNEFIGVAEENGFILPLGYWVIQESVRQLKAWKNTPFENLKISINISARQFQDGDLLKKLEEYTQDIERAQLDIELTESVFVNNYDNQYKIIHKIKELGFSLSLDDFGTGYSSLSYLKNLPFNTIKIDKVFIDDLTTQKGEEFVKMIINIAKILNLEVVAEGVETQEQERFLKAIECDSYQGYLCSKPLPVTAFEQLLQKGHYL
jgi:diguanylate cyclase (GGDEF)-like protein